MNINELEQQAQYEVIAKLQTKVQKLEEENSHLKLMVEGTTPVIQDLNPTGLSNERLICEVQIAVLKQRAVVQELTMEEARKLQIYVDVLEKIKVKKDDGVKADISEEQLLQLVKNE